MPASNYSYPNDNGQEVRYISEYHRPTAGMTSDRCFPSLEVRRNKDPITPRMSLYRHHDDVVILCMSQRAQLRTL